MLCELIEEFGGKCSPHPFDIKSRPLHRVKKRDFSPGCPVQSYLYPVTLLVKPHSTRRYVAPVDDLGVQFSLLESRQTFMLPSL